MTVTKLINKQGSGEHSWLREELFSGAANVFNNNNNNNLILIQWNSYWTLLKVDSSTYDYLHKTPFELPYKLWINTFPKADIPVSSCGPHFQRLQLFRPFLCFSEVDIRKEIQLASETYFNLSTLHCCSSQ